MSRLIFEGDTTKRFGEKIPRPFIEQVRAYDNGLEVDIAFYFKVPNDDASVEVFLSSLKSGALSQSIILSAVAEKTLDALKSSKDFNLLSEMFLEQSSNLEDTAFARRRAISISDFINGNSTPPPRPDQNPGTVNTLAVAADGRPKVTATKYSSYNVAIKDDFYNLEGTRFMKIFGTLPIDYNASGEMYVTCFVKNN